MRVNDRIYWAMKNVIYVASDVLDDQESLQGLEQALKNYQEIVDSYYKEWEEDQYSRETLIKLEIPMSTAANLFKNDCVDCACSENKNPADALADAESGFDYLPANFIQQIKNFLGKR